jgi:hypothetical protein
VTTPGEYERDLYLASNTAFTITGMVAWSWKDPGGIADTHAVELPRNHELVGNTLSRLRDHTSSFFTTFPDTSVNRKSRPM